MLSGFSRHMCAFRPMVLAGIGLTLAGCATYRAQPLSPAKTADRLEARGLSGENLRVFFARQAPELAKPWPRSTWNLDALALAARYFSPHLEMARAKLAAAQAAVVTAGARPNPSIGLSPTYDADAMAGVSPWTLGFMLDVPIETTGKRGYRLAQAHYQANAAALAVSSTVWMVRSRVRAGLLDLYGADLKLGILAKLQAAQTQAVQLLKERQEAGQSSLQDVQLVRVAAAQTALQLRDVQKQLALARVRLAEAMGVPVGALDHVEFSFEAFQQTREDIRADALRRTALLNRADVLGSLSEYEASQAALQLEIARQYPDLHLGPGYAWDQGESKFSLGVSLTLPVFNHNQGPIAEAEAHRREAAANFTSLQARIIGQVDGAVADYRDSGRKLETADELLAAQRGRMQAMRDSFAAGASDRLELKQTEIELHTAELSRAEAAIEVQQARGALEDALQASPDSATVGDPPKAVASNSKPL